MRRLTALIFITAILAVLLIPAVEGLAGSKKASSGGSVYVHGYFRGDGTYVRPHVRSAPDGNPYNNYGFPGNYNPNTGGISPGDPEKYLERYYHRSNRLRP